MCTRRRAGYVRSRPAWNALPPPLLVALLPARLPGTLRPGPFGRGPSGRGSGWESGSDWSTVGGGGVRAGGEELYWYSTAAARRITVVEATRDVVECMAGG